MENTLPKFYFINLDKSKNRLDHMTNFFKKLEEKLEFNIRYERVNALDGNNMNINNYCNLELNDMCHSKIHNIKLSGPEFGCTYSHMKAINQFLNDSYNIDDIAFICEDDIDLFSLDMDKFKKILNDTLKLVPDNELISLFCGGSPIIINSLIHHLNKYIYLDYNNYKGKLYGTGCYVISRKLAKKIIDKYWENNKLILEKNDNSMVADYFIYQQSESTKFIIPSLFTIKSENDSCIHPSHLKMHEDVQKMIFLIWQNILI